MCIKTNSRVVFPTSSPFNPVSLGVSNESKTMNRSCFWQTLNPVPPDIDVSFQR